MGFRCPQCSSDFGYNKNALSDHMNGCEGGFEAASSLVVQGLMAIQATAVINEKPTKNKSLLSDDCFFKLSKNGQDAANRSAAARQISEIHGPPRPVNLTGPQKQALLRAHRSWSYFTTSSDCRSEFKLCDAGLMNHLGGEIDASRPTARFQLTEYGATVAKQLLAEN